MSEELQKKLSQLLLEFKERLKQIRGYRLSLDWLQEFEIEAYGRKMPLKGLCHIVQLDPLTFRLELWDNNILPEIERSLRVSGVSLQVYREARNLMVKFPPLTEELKKELLKSLHQLKEEYRVKARLERDTILKSLKQKKEVGELAEDNFYREKEKIDEEVGSFNNAIEELVIQKEKEIL